MRKGAHAAAVAGAAAILAGCGGEIGEPYPGGPLASGGIGFGTKGRGALIVGREYVLLLVPAHNESDEPVVLERVEMLGLSGGESGEVVAVDVEPRDIDDKTYPGGGMVEVVTAPRPNCRERRRFAELPGYTVSPGGIGPYLAIRVRALAPGTFRFTGQRVYYRQGAIRYFQDLGLKVQLEVRRKPLPLPAGERGRPCALIERV